MKIKNDKTFSVGGVKFIISDVEQFITETIKAQQYNIENPFELMLSSGAVSFKWNDEYFIFLDKKVLRFLSKRTINKLISHEMGHIRCGHFDYNSSKDDLEKEIEADDVSIANGKGIFNLYSLIIANIFRWLFCRSNVPHNIKRLVLSNYIKFIFDKTVFIRMKHMINTKEKQFNILNENYSKLIAC